MIAQIPHDVGAERAILGAIMLRPDTLHDAASDGVTRSTFYREAHALLWDVFATVGNAGALDLVTVAGELDRRGKLESIGGYSYLAGLAGSCPSVTNAPQYIATARASERARRALQAIKTAEHALTSGDDPDDACAALQAVLSEADAVEDTVSWESDTADAVFARIRDGKRGSTVYPSPWPSLNEEIGGLCDKEVTIVVAQPRTGKSVFADQWARHLAVEDGIPGCYFALEMDRDRMTERRLSATAAVSYSAVQSGRVSPEELVQLDSARALLGTAPLRTDEAMLTMEQIWARTRSGVRREGWKWIVIDHAHIVRASDPKAPRTAQLEHVGLLSKQIAKDCGVAVLLAAQMNKDALKRGDKRPQIGDIAYGSAMEQTAATVIGLYRDELYNPETTASGMAEAIPIKARFGQGRRCRLRWQGHLQRFMPIAGGGWGE